MTSKNILLFGTLLLLLLMTVCSALFLDRHNPMLDAAASEETISNTMLNTLPQEELFIKQVPINTLPKKSLTQHKVTVETNISVSQHISKPKTIQNKIDYNQSIKSQQTKNVKRTYTTQHQKIKTHITHPKLKLPKKRILIESVLFSKNLTVSDNGKLYRWDTSLLLEVAKRIKNQNRLYIKLTTTTIGKKERVYLQNIRRYLLRQNVKKQQIKIIVEKHQSNTNFVQTIGRPTIELAIVERI